MTSSDDVPGLDLDRLRAWLDAEHPGVVAGALRASLITGGKSNLTYAVTDGNRTLVVRRPPLGHVLATAHDMSREHRIIAALAPTAVPVPGAIALCEDTDVIGAPFYVMDHVPGAALSRASQLADRSPERVRTIVDALTDTLATLHAVDYREIGLADFGRPEGYLERQVRRWKKQLEASHSRELPGLDELIAYLDSGAPSSQDSTIVHGDYRLDNALVDDDDTITAVLDWEMSTLGDPLCDVALMAAYQTVGGAAGAAVVSDVSVAPGYPSVDDVLERYASTSGRDLGDLGYYLAFSYFKLAVILEGIHYRHVHGQTLGSGFDGIGQLVYPLIDLGLKARTSTG